MDAVCALGDQNRGDASNWYVAYTTAKGCKQSVQRGVHGASGNGMEASNNAYLLGHTLQTPYVHGHYSRAPETTSPTWVPAGFLLFSRPKESRHKQSLC